MLWTDEIKKYADSLSAEQRKEYMKGLREGFRFGNYLFPRRGDSRSSTRTMEFATLVAWLESEKEDNNEWH